MTLGTFPTRFDRWGRGPAIALLAALAALLILAAWPAASTPQPKTRASESEQSDLDLYRDTIRRVGAGEPYYPVAADQLRKGGYPLKPFVTFRLPTLAMIYAQVPEILMSIVEGLLALGVVFVWWRRLEHALPFRMAAIGVVLLVGVQLDALGSDLVTGLQLGVRDWVILGCLPIAFAILATLAARLAVLAALRRVL